MCMAVDQDVAVHHWRKVIFVVDVTVCGVQSFSIDGENAVVCHHREVKDHLVYLCLTVSAYCVDLIFSFI